MKGMEGAMEANPRGLEVAALLQSAIEAVGVPASAWKSIDTYRFVERLNIENGEKFQISKRQFFVVYSRIIEQLVGCEVSWHELGRPARRVIALAAGFLNHDPSFRTSFFSNLEAYATNVDNWRPVLTFLLRILSYSVEFCPDDIAVQSSAINVLFDLSLRKEIPTANIKENLGKLSAHLAARSPLLARIKTHPLDTKCLELVSHTLLFYQTDRSIQSKFRNDFLRELWAVWMAQVDKSNAAGAVEIEAAWKPVLKYLANATFGSNSPVDAYASLLRVSKRSPEVGLRLFRALVEQSTSVDVQKTVVDTDLVGLIRKDRSEIRNAAMALLSTVVQKVTTVETALLLLEHVVDIINRGTLPRGTEREALLSALYICTLSPAPLEPDHWERAVGTFFSPKGILFDRAIGTSATVHDAARHTAFLLLGRYIGLVNYNSSIKHLCQYLSKVILEDKPSTIASCFAALRLSLTSDNNTKTLVSPVIAEELVKVLHEFIDANSRKVALRSLILEAFLILSLYEKCGVRGVCSPAAKALIVASDSPLNSPSILMKFSAADIWTYIHFLSNLLESPRFAHSGGTVFFDLPFVFQEELSLEGENRLQICSLESFNPSRIIGRSLVALLSCAMERNLWSFSNCSGAPSDVFPDAHLRPPGLHISLSSVLTNLSQIPWAGTVLITGAFDLLFGISDWVRHGDSVSRVDSEKELESVVDFGVTPAAFRATVERIFFVFRQAKGTKHELSPAGTAVVSGDGLTLAALVLCHPDVNAMRLSLCKVPHIESFTSKWLARAPLVLPRPSALVYILKKLLLISHQKEALPESRVSPDEIADELQGSCGNLYRAVLRASALLNPALAYSVSRKTFAIPGVALPIDYNHNSVVLAGAEIMFFCLQLLPVNVVSTWTSRHVEIFFAPEGVLCQEEGVYVAQVVEAGKVKLNKAQRELYGDAALDLVGTTAAQTRASHTPQRSGGTARGSAARGTRAPIKASKTKQELQQAEIGKQSRLRESMRRLLQLVQFSLEGITILAYCNENVLCPHMRTLVRHLTVLLRCPVTANDAFRALSALCNKFLPKTIISSPTRIPDLFFHVVNCRGPLEVDQCSLLTATQSAVALDVAGIAIMETIIFGILQKAPSYDSSSQKAALDFCIAQLRSERPKLEVEPLLSGIDTLLRCHAARSAQCSIALDQICSKLIEESHIESLVTIGKHNEAAVRFAVVMALRRCRCVITTPGNAFLLGALHEKQLLKIAETAEKVRDSLGLNLSSEVADALFADLSAESPVWRDMAAAAWAKSQADLIAAGTGSFSGAVRKLLDSYRLVRKSLDRDTIAARKIDPYIVIGNRKDDDDREFEPLIDTSEAVEPFLTDRNTLFAHLLGLARAFSGFLELVPAGDICECQTIMTFILIEALNDSELSSLSSSPTAELIRVWQTAGLNLLNKTATAGLDSLDIATTATELHAILEGIQDKVVLATSGSSSASAAFQIHNRAEVDYAAALFFGGIARYLPNHDVATRSRILERLLARIQDPTTPSRAVQRAIADVLPPLVKTVCSNTDDQSIKGHVLVNRLLEQSLNGSAYTVRAGASLALAAVVKGLGLSSMKEVDLLKKVLDAAGDGKTSAQRQGGLLCLRGLAEILGRLFEPYVAQATPVLLTSFSDSTDEVRTEAQATARSIFGNLSAYGTKLVLPGLISKVSDPQWRTKTGAIELLAAMAHGAPKQLSSLLPRAVPLLSDAAADSHPKVREATKGALRTIAEVATNEEIRRVSPLLLKALTEPSIDTTRAVLDALLNTEFTHAMDAASLSLICPIILRAFRERSSDMKKKAAAIVACLVHLCDDPRNFLPYFHLLCPKLQDILIDPIPDVRSVAARALGTVAKAVGDENLGDLLLWFLERLRSKESSVERSGAANGFSEVLAALGPQKLEELLPNLLQNAEHPQPEVREGYLGLFIFLPTSFGQDFNKFVPDVLPVLLRGLSVDPEQVRDVAFRAAQVLVNQYGSTHTILLLSPLEEGIFSPDWKIRHSSVQLLGTLVSRLLRFVPDQEGSFDPEILSLERRAFILAAVYIVRSDENPAVRQAATDAWKEVVQNTPKTLQEILPILTKRLMRNLLSDEINKRNVAAHCIGDLSQKMPEKILPPLIPACVAALVKPEPTVRHGALVGLTQLVENCSAKALLADFTPVIVPAVQGALSDEFPAVMNAATAALRALLEALGAEALVGVVNDGLKKATVPPLLDVAVAAAERAPQIIGLEALLDAQPQAILTPILRCCCAPPADVTRVRLASVIAVLKTSKTIFSALPRLLPLFITVEALTHFENDTSTVADADPAVGHITDGVLLSETERQLYDFLQSCNDPAIAGLTPKSLRGFDAVAIRSEVLRCCNRIFRKVVEHPCQLLQLISSSINNESSAALADLTAAGRMKAKHILLQNSINIDQETQNHATALQSESALTATVTPLSAKTDSLGPFSPAFAAVVQTHAGLFEKRQLNPLKRCATVDLYRAALETVFNTAPMDAIVDAIQFLIPLAASDVDARVRRIAGNALHSVVTMIRKSERGYFAVAVRETIAKMVLDPVTMRPTKSMHLVGFSSLTTFEAVYSILHICFACTNTDVRECAAQGIGEAVLRTDGTALKSVIVKLTGPLVRMTTEKLPHSVKAEILRSLTCLMLQAGLYLKPLLPQLQVTFLKAMVSPSVGVRHRASVGLQVLALQPSCRLPTLLSELGSIMGASSVDPAVRVAALHCAAAILEQLPPGSLPEGAETKLLEHCETILFGAGTDKTSDMRKELAAAVIGTFMGRHAHEDRLENYVRGEIIPALKPSAHGSVDVKEGAATLAGAIAGACTTSDKADNSVATAVSLALMAAGAAEGNGSTPELKRIAISAFASLAISPQAQKRLLPEIVAAASSITSAPVLQPLLKALKQLAKADKTLTMAERAIIVTLALDSLTLTHPGIRLNAERVLFHALNIPESEVTDNKIIQTIAEHHLPTARRTFLLDYSRRVLSRLESDSDDESPPEKHNFMAALDDCAAEIRV